MKQSFKHYLTEASITPVRRVAIEEKHVVEFINKHCSRAVIAHSRGKGIYRGVETAPDSAYVVNLNASTRKSQNISNYYTRVLDTNPSNEKYPLRSKSMICATSDNIASRYGEVLWVFPFDNTTIGICPDEDIWDFNFMFKGQKYTIETMNVKLKFLGLDEETVDFKSAVSAIKNASKGEIEAIVEKDALTDNEVDEFQTSWIKIYYYKFNDAVVVEPQESYAPGHEVWFSGQAVTIPEDMAKRLFNK